MSDSHIEVNGTRVSIKIWNEVQHCWIIFDMNELGSMSGKHAE